jgi:hypothetical protein
MVGAEPAPAEWRKTDPGVRSWAVQLRYQGRSLGPIAFYTGSGIKRAPGAADVLSCLILDIYSGEETFEDFCSELGFDPDSRTAEKTWKACSAMAPHVRALLGDDFEIFAEAEH